MGEAGVGLLKLSDGREDYQPIIHHCQWISWGHSLLTEEEVTRLISCPDHQHVPVALAVECELRTTGPLMPHLPQHGCAFLLIERIARVNE